MKNKDLRKDTRTSEPGWKEFEKSTRRALEALGYAVIENSLISGSQVDLIALRSDKLVPYQLLVECKSSGKPVGVDEVRSFSSVVHSIPPADVATFGLLVAMSGFTKEAREFAKTVGLKLTTLQELGLKVFDPAPIVNRAISWFENDALSRTYVDLTCTIHEYGIGTVYKPVEKFFDEYFSNTKRHGVAVLGNFGSGKTSLCRHYAYLLATRWRNHQESALLPIYVNLRDLPDLCSIERELQNLLQTEYDLSCSAEELRAWLDVGRTLLILDGFDEMGARLSNADVHRSLEALARFAGSSRAKIILTCRTHFFRNRIDEDALTNTIRLYVRDWGAEELVNYVNRAHGASSQKTISTIRQTYNLEELARTPMFLKMITDTVAAFQNEVNRGKLYQLYTDQWIESQDYRTNLSPQEVRSFMQGLAQEVYTSGSNTIDYRDLPNHIQESMRLRDRKSISQFDQDIRTCTFLVRDTSGGYGFVHRSFMEFFLGLKLAEELKARNSTNFSRIEMSVEVAGFTACFFESEPDLLARMLMSDATETARANCARALADLCSSPRIEDAMVLALDMDPSPIVRRRLIESLASAKSERGIDRMLQLALVENELGLLCLRELGPLHQKPAVHELFSGVLRGGLTADRIGVVLEAVSTHRIAAQRASLTALLIKADWRMRPSIGSQLLGAVSAIADSDLAVASLELLEALSRESNLAASVRQTTDDLAGRCRAAVDQMARAGREKGLSHGANLSALRKRFGLLLIDDQVNSLLADLYGGAVRIKGRKVSRAKGG